MKSIDVNEQKALFSVCVKKGKYRSMDNIKIETKRGLSYQNNELLMKGINKLKETYLIAPSLHMFTYIYSLLIDKDLCESQNISIKFLCALSVYSCLSSEDLFMFL
jgi:hypothetical protein